jgi:hypothetical protein
MATCKESVKYDRVTTMVPKVEEVRVVTFNLALTEHEAGTLKSVLDNTSWKLNDNIGLTPIYDALSDAGVRGIHTDACIKGY